MSSLYETDIVAWSEQQASAMRGLAMLDCSGEVDWPRVADGVEAVGNAATTRVEDGVRSILAQAILGYCQPDSPCRRLRSSKVLHGRFEAQELTSTMRDRLSLDRLWREAFEIAMAGIEPGILAVPPSIPHTCPFTLDETLDEDFTYDRAVEQLYIRLTSWRPQPAKDAA